MKTIISVNLLLIALFLSVSIQQSINGMNQNLAKNIEYDIAAIKSNDPEKVQTHLLKAFGLHPSFLSFCQNFNHSLGTSANACFLENIKTLNEANDRLLGMYLENRCTVTKNDTPIHKNCEKIEYMLYWSKIVIENKIKILNNKK